MDDMWNGVKLPWDDIPPEVTIPTSNCDMIGVSAELTKSNKEESSRYDPDKPQKLMIAVSFQVEAPVECKGMFFNNWYVVASDDKPNVFDSRSRGAIQFKWLLNACNIPSTVEPAMAVKGLEGALCGMSIKDGVDKQDQPKNFLMGKPYKRNEKQPQLLEKGVKTVSASGGAVSPPPPGGRKFDCPTCDAKGMSESEYAVHSCPE